MRVVAWNKSKNVGVTLSADGGMFSLFFSMKYKLLKIKIPKIGYNAIALKTNEIILSIIFGIIEQFAVILQPL